MKYFLLISSLLIFSIVDAQNIPEASELKSQIKSLEKVAKSAVKDVEKLEIALAKVKPEAEQAKRKAKALEDLYANKKAAFDAFDYAAKEDHYKSLKKEAKKAAKSYEKLLKKEEKLRSEISDLQESRVAEAKAVAAAKSNLAEIEGKISVYPPDEQERLLDGLKDQTLQDSLEISKAQKLKQNIAQKKEAEKTLKDAEKNADKIADKLAKAQGELAELEAAEGASAANKAKLEKAENSAERELSTMDAKAVQKELSNYKQQRSEAQAKYENLNKKIAEQQKIIDEKYDLVEAKKQEIRKKQSILDKL